eukprot:4489064-Alexandrium_andersonii.AAC.1
MASSEGTERYAATLGPALHALPRLNVGRVPSFKGPRDPPLEVWQVVAADAEVAEELTEVLANAVGVLRMHLQE